MLKLSHDSSDLLNERYGSSKKGSQGAYKVQTPVKMTEFQIKVRREQKLEK